MVTGQDMAHNLESLWPHFQRFSLLLFGVVWGVYMNVGLTKHICKAQTALSIFSEEKRGRRGWDVPKPMADMENKPLMLPGW